MLIDERAERFHGAVEIAELHVAVAELEERFALEPGGQRARGLELRIERKRVRVVLLLVKDFRFHQRHLVALDAGRIRGEEFVDLFDERRIVRVVEHLEPFILRIAGVCVCGKLREQLVVERARLGGFVQHAVRICGEQQQLGFRVGGEILVGIRERGDDRVVFAGVELQPHQSHARDLLPLAVALERIAA